MKTLFLKLSVLALAGTLAGGLGTSCDKKTGNGTGGASGSGGSDAGAGGSGGAVGYDVQPDVPMGPEVSPIDISASEAVPPRDGPGGEAGAVGDDICKGLTPADCHLRIINSTNPAAIPQDPGPNPAVGYPACTAI